MQLVPHPLLWKTNQMAARDGDGWVICRCGSKHWGLNGAAGLLLIQQGRILLQHRAPWVHNGDTWGIPGGARDSHESPLEAALRESHEEIGIEASRVTSLFSHVDDHGDWSYVTIVASVDSSPLVFAKNHETLDLRWFEVAEVGVAKLHPSFAKSWIEISDLLVNGLDGDDGVNP